MSDQPADPYGSQPPTNPYGAPPPPPNPYGTGGPQPYGTDGPQPYGVPAPRNPDDRPGTVLAAVIITLICSVLVGLTSLLGLIGLIVARDSIVDDLRGNSDFSSYDGNEIVTIGGIVLAVLLAWCVAAIVLALLVLRRSSIARILLVVSAAVTALLSLVAILSGVSTVTLIASVAVIVLLLTGGANPWFSRRSA